MGEGTSGGRKRQGQAACQQSGPLINLAHSPPVILICDTLIYLLSELYRNILLASRRSQFCSFFLPESKFGFFPFPSAGMGRHGPIRLHVTQRSSRTNRPSRVVRATIDGLMVVVNGIFASEDLHLASSLRNNEFTMGLEKYIAQSLENNLTKTQQYSLLWNQDIEKCKNLHS